MAKSIKLGSDTYLDASGVNSLYNSPLSDVLQWRPLWQGSIQTGQATISGGARLYALMFASESNSSSTRGIVFAAPGVGTQYYPAIYAGNVTYVRATAALSYITIDAVGDSRMYLKTVYGLL